MRTKIISDICGNFIGDFRILRKMAQDADRVGCDYVKFQLFRAKDLNPDWPNYENAVSAYKENEIETGGIEYILSDVFRDLKAKPLFTTFTLERAKTLRNYTDEIVKIASPDADNWELLGFCIDSFKAVIVSTGMTDEKNIRKLLAIPNVKVLYCVSKYPTNPNEIDFGKMQMTDGFSDHTIGIETAKKAIDLGVEYVERHLTLGKYLPGSDHFFSSTPDEFEELCKHRDYVHKTELYKRRWTNGL